MGRADSSTLSAGRQAQWCGACMCKVCVGHTPPLHVLVVLLPFIAGKLTTLWRPCCLRYAPSPLKAAGAGCVAFGRCPAVGVDTWTQLCGHFCAPLPAPSSCVSGMLCLMLSLPVWSGPYGHAVPVSPVPAAFRRVLDQGPQQSRGGACGKCRSGNTFGLPLPPTQFVL